MEPFARTNTMYYLLFFKDESIGAVFYRINTPTIPAKKQYFHNQYDH